MKNWFQASKHSPSWQNLLIPDVICILIPWFYCEFHVTWIFLAVYWSVNWHGCWKYKFWVCLKHFDCVLVFYSQGFVKTYYSCHFILVLCFLCPCGYFQVLHVSEVVHHYTVPVIYPTITHIHSCPLYVWVTWWHTKQILKGPELTCWNLLFSSHQRA